MALHERMRMYFDTYGPFEINREVGLVASRQDELWLGVREICESYGYEQTELEQAIGCYVFALRNGTSYRPWYVGMTLAEGGFRAEVLHKHKRDHYNAVLSQRKGVPIMFIMPLLTPEGRFCRDRKTNKRLIEWVEKMLFGVALKRNPKCRNERDTKFLRNVVVNGVFNSRPIGRPGPSVVAARRMFGGFVSD